MEVVKANEPQAEDFLGLDEMSNVRPREVSAGVALAILFNRRGIFGEGGILKRQRAVACECRSVTRHAGR